MKHDRRTFLRNSALTGGALTLRNLAQAVQPLASAATSEPTDSEFIRKQFQSPAKKYGPIARWWWPGNDVTDEELQREIGVLDRAGFAGAEIQAFNKGFDPQSISHAQMQRIDSFATPSFFRHVAAATEEARKRGLFIDYTFGSGWPFGGGDAITPELAAIELRSTHVSIEGPATFKGRLQIPAVTDGDILRGSPVLSGLPEGWPERMKRRSRVVAVIAVRGTDAQWDYSRTGWRELGVRESGRLDQGTAIDLTRHLDPDGTFHWDVPSGTWQLFVFCSVPTAQHLNGSAGAGPQLVMDHMSAEAFAAHAKRVGDNAIPYLGQYFGNGLRAIFCDSLEVAASLFWSDDFLAEFQRRRGYDLLPYLPILRVQSHSEPFGKFVDRPLFDIPEIGNQVRHDYRQTVSDIMAERFYGQFNKWARDHKLLSRTQAHGSPTDVLRVYGESHIPETEDLYDNGGYDFLKMAASAANLYGRTIVGSESFVWPGAAYETTPEKMKLASDELITAGINAIVYHGFAYLVPGIPAPGWHPFRGVGEGNYSSQMNELNPFWPYVAQLNGYIARLQFISQAGTNVAAVALLHDSLTHGAEETPPAPRLNQALLDAGYNYDHINARSLQRCTMRDGALISTGGALYRALIVPPLEAIDAASAEALQKFASAGLPIVFAGAAPSRASGFLDNAAQTQRVQAAIQSLRETRHAHFCTGINEAIAALTQSTHPNIRFRETTLPFIQKRIGAMNAYFLRNPSDQTQHIAAGFEAEGEPELWDPWTGNVTSLANPHHDGPWVEIELDLDPLSSALIVFDPGHKSAVAPSAPARALKHAEPVGTSGWKLAATGDVSGKSATIHRDLPALIDWSLDPELRGFCGRGVYSTSFTVNAIDESTRIILDLGSVRDVAEIKVNGKQAATLLLRPYRADISEFVHPGENQFEITVTNALFNSMVLRQPRPFRPGGTENPSGLMSAGLLGPVQIKLMT